MDYKELLERSYKIEVDMNDDDYSVHEYLADYIFDLTTYDGGIAEVLADAAIGVCQAITERKTFEFISDSNRYIWFITMCNMDFFKSKINWGCSIRGAWWDVYGDNHILIKSCGLFNEKGNQVLKLSFNKEEWLSFIKSVLEFYSENK